MGDDDGSAFLDELKKYTKIHEIKAEKLDEMITPIATVQYGNYWFS